jgi:uncharacterized OB-fold protein
MAHRAEVDTQAAEVVFRPDSWDRSHEDGPVLLAGRCQLCNALSFPIQRFCPNCLGDKSLEVIRLSREGILYSFSTVRVPSPGFDSPYLVGYVDLPEGVRIFAQLAATTDEVTVNDRMILVEGPIRRMPDGSPVLGYKFAPTGRRS